MIGCTAVYVTTAVSAYSVVIPETTAVIPKTTAVIPAKAGIYLTHKREICGLRRSSLTMDSRLRGNDGEGDDCRLVDIEQELGGALEPGSDV